MNVAMFLSAFVAVILILINQTSAASVSFAIISKLPSKSDVDVSEDFSPSETNIEETQSTTPPLLERSEDMLNAETTTPVVETTESSTPATSQSAAMEIIEKVVDHQHAIKWLRVYKYLPQVGSN